MCVEGYKYSVICACMILGNWDRACLLAQNPSYQPPNVDPSEGTVQCLHAHRGISDNQTAMIDIIIPHSDRRFCTYFFLYLFFLTAPTAEKNHSAVANCRLGGVKGQHFTPDVFSAIRAEGDRRRLQNWRRSGYKLRQMRKKVGRKGENVEPSSPLWSLMTYYYAYVLQFITSCCAAQASLGVRCRQAGGSKTGLFKTRLLRKLEYNVPTQSTWSQIINESPLNINCVTVVVLCPLTSSRTRTKTMHIVQ